MRRDWRVKALEARYVAGEIEVEEFEAQLDALLRSTPMTSMQTADAILKDVMRADAAARAAANAEKRP